MVDFAGILEQKEKVQTSIGESVHIDSIMIEDNGKVYQKFYKDDSLHELRSISKVFVALAYGIAIDRKMLVNGNPITLDTPIYPIIKDLCEIDNLDNLDKIKQWTIRTLLTYSAGYESQMFSEKFIKDICQENYLKYILNFPILNNPNEKYAYNNAEIFLLSVYFQEAFGINLTDFINKEIFKPLSIENFIWKNYGKYCPGGTGLYLCQNDLFKVGQMMLRGGEFAERRIVSKEWISQMCSFQMKTPYAVKKERLFPKEGVGFVMHISRDGFSYKDGTNGQYLILNQKKNLLISILSSEKEMNLVTEILRNKI